MPRAKEMDAAQFAVKMAKKTPKNLQDVPSAHDISAVNAPKNIYDQSSMARMYDAKRIYEENSKKASYKKIINDIQKQSMEAGIDKE